MKSCKRVLELDTDTFVQCLLCKDQKNETLPLMVHPSQAPTPRSFLADFYMDRHSYEPSRLQLNLIV